MNYVKSIGLAAVLTIASTAAARQTQTHQGHDAPTAQQRDSAQAHRMDDAEFVAMMLQHHRDGIEMARVAEQKATNADVKALARKIREGQERESREMKPFAGRDATPTGTSGQHTAQGGTHQAEQQAESKKAIERVRAATGTQVDHAFIEEMTKHHQMAIQMTRNTQFQNSQLKQMADKMSANQTREIDELKRTHQRVS